MASSSPPQRQSRFYFAFGSNLHLGQMAKRCPESRYVGVATLHGWRFQINNRRYANIVPSPGSYVEGLVYRLNLTDEAKLDKSEGVRTGAYEKWILDVELFTKPIEHVARAVPELAKELEASEPYITDGNENMRRSASRNRRSLAGGHTRHEPRVQATVEEEIDYRPGRDNSGGFQHHSLTFKGQLTQALVYLSPKHVQEGKPWDEYIDRMNSGIIDARKLGLTDRYIKHYLRRYIPDRELPGHILTPTRRIPGNLRQPSRVPSPTRHSSLERRRRPRIYNSRSRPTGSTAVRGQRGQPVNARTYDPWHAEPNRYNESSRY